MQEIEKNILLAIMVTTAFIALFSIITFMAIIKISRRKQQLLLEQELMEAKFQREVLQAGLELQEQTFQTISQEIHDNVGQILSLAKLNLNILAMDNGELEQVRVIKNLISNAIDELRNLSLGYHADQLISKGLIYAIAHQIEQLKQTGLFKVSYNTEVETIQINKNRKIFLYRIIQELINNIIRHSGATEVSCKISFKANQFLIVMADNGKGFDEYSKDFQPGLGLHSIHQRAAMIGASVILKSNPGRGTTCSIQFKSDAND